MNIKETFKKKKALSHGGAALIITALVIAAVIVVNAGISALSNASLWYFDMTSARVFTLSDEVKEILEPVSADVNIYFTKDENALMSGDGTNEYMKFIYQTARELENEFSNINVKCVDVIEHPAFFEYYYNTAATNILTTSVIIESNGEFRLMSSDAFFVWDENRTYIWGYNGEAKFAAAILQVTSSDMLAICFTEGHGEKSPDDSAAFRDLCEAAGYDVRTIDLSKEEIGDDVRILIINDPLYDFAGIEAGELGDELDKLSAFLNSYGTVMVFADSEKSKNLVNLSEFLLEWGIELSPGKVVVDPSSSLTVDGTELVAEYETADTLGASLYNSISSLSSMPKTIVPNAMPLKLVYGTKSVTMGMFETSTVLYSPDGATVKDGEGSESTGRLPVMTITRKEGIRDNDYIYAYLTVCGSPDFVADKYLNSASYANSDILVNTIRLTGREKIVADIDLKMLDDTALDITAAETNGWTLALAVIIPLAVGAAGVVICRRRRKL
ncbi:MAG: Gldg family protein [Clostridia bacterium]|nr:Gldg family protein [Clostridia bacterium]